MRVPRTSTSLVSVLAPVPVSLRYLSATSRGDSGHQFQDKQNSRCPDSPRRRVRPGRTNSYSGRTCSLAIILSIALPGLALAGDPLQDADGIRPVDSSPADQGLSVTQSHLTREGEGEDQSVRVRIETGQGVFVVYDAAIPAKPIVRGDRVGAPRKRGGYLAY